MYKQNFLPYPLETITDTTYFSKYREIKAGKLNEIIKKNKTTAVFLSNITCPSPGNKIRISAYEKIVKEMGNVTPVYVFSGFRIPTIHMVLEGNDIQENMHFIHHTYSSNIGIMEHNFFKELGIELKSDKFRREPLDWAIFQDEKLIQKCHSDFEGVELRRFLQSLKTVE
ncbi:MAG: hypothetical protein PHU27_03990 [Salinivirgaceae bacterium]|nr:hypothetical protein [Salinivirgaceae bacterium]